MIHPGLFEFFLTTDQISYLHNSPFFELFEIPIDQKFKSSKKKVKSSNTSQYLVTAIEGWLPIPPARIVTHVYDGVYVVESPDDSILIKDHQIRSIKDVPELKLLNRFTSGFLRSGSQDNILTDDPKTNYSPFRYKWTEINGSGQIVTVSDSGIDVTHPFFADPDVPVPFGTRSLIHRKIVGYDVHVDNTDEFRGHGTHVCGTIAGSYPCEHNCPKVSRYEGIAPEAKLFFVDLAQTGSGNKSLNLFDADQLLQNMTELDSNISSGSWGISPSDLSYTRIWEKVTYEHPDQLFIFAAGNEYYLVNSPSDCKNCVAVAASTLPTGSFANEQMFINPEDPVTHAIIEGFDTFGNWSRIGGYDATVVTLLRIDVWDSLDYFLNHSTVKISSNLPMYGKVVIDDSDSEITNATVESYVQQNAIGIIFFSDEWDLNFRRWDSCPIIIVSNALKDLVLNFTNVSFFSGVLSSPSKELNRASFSSVGPSVQGFDGPLIAAPGDFHIWSALSNGTAGHDNSTNFFDVIFYMGGTSMATPAISGFAALIRQYLFDLKIYPSSYQMRAILANCATSIGPRVETGYGIPNLQTFIETPRFLLDRKTIPSNSHHRYDVEVLNGTYPFQVTLSYLDPPLADDAVWPLFADLNLIVITPSNYFYEGNDFTDSFATNEKVIVPDPIPGTYQIHVTSNTYATSSERVSYALAISGNINDAKGEPDQQTVQNCPRGCGQGQCRSGQCVCNSGWIGIYCDHSIINLAKGKKVSVTLRLKEVQYFTLEWDSSKEWLQVVYENEGEPFLYNLVMCESQFPSPIGSPDYVCKLPNVAASGDGQFPFNLGEENQSIWLAVYCVSNKTCQFNLHWEESDTESGLSKGAMIGIIVVCVAIAAIVAVVAICCRCLRVCSGGRAGVSLGGTKDPLHDAPL